MALPAKEGLQLRGVEVSSSDKGTPNPKCLDMRARDAGPQRKAIHGVSMHVISAAIVSYHSQVLGLAYVDFDFAELVLASHL